MSRLVADPFAFFTFAVFTPQYSPAFLKHQKYQHGKQYRFPKERISSVPVGQPMSLKIVTRSCQDCCGVLLLAKSWNTDVEEAMKVKTR
jgi:hypothetical protein